jgi:hypothetical protein
MLIEIGPNLTEILMEHLRQIGSLSNDGDRLSALSEFGEVTRHLLDKVKGEDNGL